MTTRLCLASLVALAALFRAGSLPAQAPGAKPPASWVDKDTGHRIWRLTEEAGSGGFYFNVNAYTPDGRQMIYTAPDGIHVLDIASRKSSLLVANPPVNAAASSRGGYVGGPNPHTVVVGHKTNSLFYTQTNPTTKLSAVYKVDTNSGHITKLTDLPRRMNIATVNADETLAAGTFDEVDAPDRQYGSNLPANSLARNPMAGPNVQAENKGAMMEARLAARIPVVLFTIRLTDGAEGKAGTVKELLHSTDWIGHMLFSPTDPTLLMYCHEGPWQKVDRIWMIHTDASHNTLIHKRTMLMEIAGHEFWGLDGKTIWYDWQYPKGEDFFLAGYDLSTGKRTAYHLQRNEWSIHFNLTQDLDLFTGDGGDPGQVAKAPDGEWIELFYPHMIGGTDGALNEPNFFQPGVFQSERLVNMKHHFYRQEPNVRFSPDKSLVLFTSNMFGPSYVFGVEVKKAVNPSAADVQSTPDLARKFNPNEPPDLHAPGTPGTRPNPTPTGK